MDLKMKCLFILNYERRKINDLNIPGVFLNNKSIDLSRKVCFSDVRSRSADVTSMYIVSRAFLWRH